MCALPCFCEFLTAPTHNHRLTYKSIRNKTRTAQILDVHLPLTFDRFQALKFVPQYVLWYTGFSFPFKPSMHSLRHFPSGKTEDRFVFYSSIYAPKMHLWHTALVCTMEQMTQKHHCRWPYNPSRQISRLWRAMSWNSGTRPVLRPLCGERRKSAGVSDIFQLQSKTQVLLTIWAV